MGYRAQEVADEIADLPEPTKWLVIDAVQVRAMDFVQDELGANDGAADLCADVYLILNPDESDRRPFDPRRYPLYNHDLEAKDVNDHD